MKRHLRAVSGGRAGDAPIMGATSRDPSTAGRAAAGDAAGMRDLYHRYGGAVYGRCYYLLKDKTKAEDAMQDVFAKAWVNMASFRAEASPLTWLTTIATNHCLNLLRAERAPWRQTFEHQESARVTRAEQEGVAGGPRRFEDREAVRKLLANLDMETQAVAIHYYVDEMTLEEVAVAVGRSVPTVRKRLEALTAARGGESLP